MQDQCSTYDLCRPSVPQRPASDRPTQPKLGRVQRLIVAMFTGNPGAVFSVADLGMVAYPGVNRVEKRHRVAVLRAAEHAADACG
jgi:hypothetical protein